MKKYIFIFIASSVIFSCKKEDAKNEQNYFGSCQVQLNNKQILFNKCAAYSKVNNDSLTLIFERWEGSILKESLSFLNVINNKLTQPVFSFNNSLLKDPNLSSSYGTSRDDGDVGCDYFKALQLNNFSNEIKINYYTPTNGEISGTFQCVYIISKFPKCNLNSPDTIWIKNGVFSTKVFQQ